MNIEKIKNDNEVILVLSGRLDTTTAPQLDAMIQEVTPNISSLVLDFTDLDYLSSSGLRVLLAAQKIMNKQGTMVIRHVNETIAEVFEITGFVDILTIQ